MCGRFSLTSSTERLNQHFNLTQGICMAPRYNIAPGQKIPVQIEVNRLDFFQWGLKPAWISEEIQQKPLINARAETIIEKPLFKQAFAKRRCLIPCDGFYEWKSLGRYKQPYYIHRKDKAMFALAGIYENETVSIITTQANAIIQNIHSRMPVIIEREDYKIWLNKTTSQPEITALLVPALSEFWHFYPVSTQMNRVEFDNPLCVKPLQ